MEWIGFGTEGCRNIAGDVRDGAVYMRIDSIASLLDGSWMYYRIIICLPTMAVTLHELQNSRKYPFPLPGFALVSSHFKSYNISIIIVTFPFDTMINHMLIDIIPTESRAILCPQRKSRTFRRIGFGPVRIKNTWHRTTWCPTEILNCNLGNISQIDCANLQCKSY